jgi:hypothetical protein
MSPRNWRRWAATPTATLTACAVTLLGVALVGTPAQAAPASGTAAQDGPSLHFSVTRDQVGLPQPADPGDAPQISWGLEGDADGGTAKDVVVKIDVSGISSFADVSGTDCVADVCSWRPQDIAPDGFAGGLLEMNAKASAPLGTTGTAKLYATSSNATVTEVPVKVSVGTVGLVVNQFSTVDAAKPGTTLDAPLTIGNTGSLTAQGVELRLASTQGLGFAQRFSNCSYGTTDDVSQAEGRTLADAVCHIATPVEPGKTYRLSTPVGITVKKTALFDFVDYQATPAATSVPTDAADATHAAPAVKGSGPVLALVQDGGTVPDPGGTDHRLWQVDSANSADIAVGGGTVTAAPGDRVTLTAKVRNNGPATFDLLTSDDQLGVVVEIPKGTTAVTVPERCRPWDGVGSGEPAPGAPQYMCAIGSPFSVGQSLTLPFTVTVDKDAPARTSGKVYPLSVNGVEPAYDTNKANSTARLTVKVKGAVG